MAQERERAPESAHGKPAGAIARTEVLGTTALSRAGLAGKKLSALPTALTSTPDAGSLLCALRRRLFLALGLAVVGALAVGVISWHAVPRAEYSAATVLHVNPHVPSLMFSLADNESRGGEDYRRYQNNQVGLIRSHLVLSAALQALDVRLLRTFDGVESPIEYLKKKIQVNFTNSSELLEIQLSGNYPDELATIVNAIAEAYQEEVVNYDHKRRQHRAETLQKTYQERFETLKLRYLEKKRLAEIVGTEDPETIAKKQQLQDQALGDLKREAMSVRLSRQRVELDLEVQGKLHASSASAKKAISRQAIDEAVLRVPSVMGLQEQYEEAYATYRRSYAFAEKVVRNPANDQQVKHAKAQVDQFAQELRNEQAAVRPLVEEQLLGAMNQTRSDELLRMELEVAALKRQELDLNNEIANQSRVMHRINQDSLEIKDKQREIEQIDHVNSMIQEEIAKLGVELQAPKRVREIERATTPQTRNDQKRYMMIGGLTLASFLTLIGLVSFAEFMTRKLTNAEQVVDGLGIQLVGSLPPLPPRLKKVTTKSTSAKESEWYQMMLESIDSTRTMLVHQAQAESLRVLLVTSALGGEGKTSLSCHLATSLVRAGYRVILVDGDLRRPAVHRVFGLPVVPGLSEVLRREVELDDVIQSTSMPDLKVLSAGESNDETLMRLSKGAVAPILERLREDYEFVIIDSAPVLPVADTQILAPHTDGVVFSTLRDVSRLPRVFVAYQRLLSLNVRILGAVVAGIRGGLYGNDSSYGYGYGYGHGGRGRSPVGAHSHGRRGG